MWWHDLWVWVTQNTFVAYHHTHKEWNTYEVVSIRHLIYWHYFYIIHWNIYIGSTLSGLHDIIYELSNFNFVFLQANGKYLLSFLLVRAFVFRKIIIILVPCKGTYTEEVQLLPYQKFHKGHPLFKFFQFFHVVCAFPCSECCLKHWCCVTLSSGRHLKASILN